VTRVTRERGCRPLFGSRTPREPPGHATVNASSASVVQDDAQEGRGFGVDQPRPPLVVLRQFDSVARLTSFPDRKRASMMKINEAGRRPLRPWASTGGRRRGRAS